VVIWGTHRLGDSGAFGEHDRKALIVKIAKLPNENKNLAHVFHLFMMPL
jgi:hypothetical protein